MNIGNNLLKIKRSIPDCVKLVAVSKTKPVSDILEAYKAGQRLFGENRAMEMAEKYDMLPKDIQWHAIGHLQRNKVRHISAFVALIHSVDSMRLLNTINMEAAKHNRIIDCLLEVHIAAETTKSGFSHEEADHLLSGQELDGFRNISVKGLMGMATFTTDELQIRKEFRVLSEIYKKHPQLQVLSMGMSGDYQIAIGEGSNMVRVGSLIFGERT